MTSPQSTTLATGAVTTRLWRAGKGPAAVLFLHGSGPGADAFSNWQFALPALADDFLGLAPDLVGFGESTHPDPPPRHIRAWMRLWVDQCLALLDTLGLGRVHLVGNSMGGCIALHLLSEAPERFERVVLMGTAGAPFRLTPELDRLWGFYEDPGEATMRRLVRGFTWDPDFVGDRLEEIARSRLAAALRPEVRRSFEAMFGGDRQRVLDALVVPEASLRTLEHDILLIHGRDDRIVPLDTSLWLLPRLPRATLHVVPRCGHWIQIEHRTRFHRLVRDHLTGA